MKKGNLVAGILLIILGIPLLFVVVGIVPLAIGIYLLLKGRDPKCTYCGKRGKIVFERSEIVRRESAYGLVTRTESVTKRKRGSSGSDARELTEIKRQERVPVVNTTTRYFYTCKNCQKWWYKDYTTQSEDFSRPDTPPPSPAVIVQKEVLKIPCKYCRTLVDPVLNKTCPSCGASFL